MAAFGKRLTPPVSAGKVNHWLRGTRRVSLAEALQIERLTGGEVTARDLAKPGPGVVCSQVFAPAEDAHINSEAHGGAHA